MKNRHIFLYIFSSVKSYKLSLFVMFFVAIIWAIDISLRPYLLKLLLNKAASLQDKTNALSQLFFPAIWLVFCSFMISSVWRLYDYFVNIRMIPRLRTTLANKAFDALMQKDHGFYLNNLAGNVMGRVSDVIMSVPEITQILIDRFFSHFIALSIACFTLWQTSPIFAFLMMSWALCFTVVAIFLSKKLTGLSANWAEKGNMVKGRMVDAFANIMSVRLFSSKGEEQKIVAHASEEACKAEEKTQRTYFKMWLFYGYSFFLVQASNIYFLLKGLEGGWVTVGDCALVVTINIAIVEFLWRLVQEFTQFSKYYGRIHQALSFINEPIRIREKKNAPPLHIKGGVISFQNVRFQYQDTEPLFQNKSVTIRSKEKVGLVGYSGSGKTTFVNLILRLYDVVEGGIFIDKQNIADVSLDSLRSVISMIPQDPALFHRSLMENIRYGRPGASDKDVMEASKKAHAHNFIMALDKGYDALVGERGIKLSGGQRQRIAIARAILKNAPLLILDEATSQLDSLTEKNIQDALWTFMQDKTTIVIAHRLSTLLRMDRILVFDEGRIVQDGTHKELLQKEGLYKTLWQAQTGGFLPDERPL